MQSEIAASVLQMHSIDSNADAEGVSFVRPDLHRMDNADGSARDSVVTSQLDVSRNSSLQAEPTFLCPGQSQPISRAVHLARLNAAWSVCDDCEWRNHSEGLATRTIEQTERIREHRLDSLRRTEFGVRGPYVNAIDRSVAADFARIFCRCFAELSDDSASTGASSSIKKTVASRTTLQRELMADPPSELAISHVTPTFAEISPIVLGYDGRPSSLDLFAGVLAAVREFGFPVIDIGRCTAASLAAAVRSHELSAGSLLVTGAGSASSWNGLDATDVNGDPMPVLWKDFSIRLHHESSHHPSETTERLSAIDLDRREDSAVDELLRRIRGELSKPPDRDAINRRGDVVTLGSGSRVLRLDLPDVQTRKQWSRRLSRESGTHQVEDFESSYREWLAAWFPTQGESRVLIRTDDELIHDRARWLKSRTGVELVARGTNESSEVPACRFAIVLEEDDRSFRIAGRRGELIDPERLALLINRASQATGTQISAHGDNASERFWLSDSVRQGASLKTHRIRDGLAILGFITRLIESGYLNL